MNLAAHLFTTRELQLSSADEGHRVAGLLGVAEVITSNQVHGGQVATVRRGSPRARSRQRWTDWRASSVRDRSVDVL